MQDVINANLIEPHGADILKAASDAGFDMQVNESGKLDIADACALVDHESGGGQNIFGCDWGDRWVDEPPYCHVPVTKERVQALISNIEAGGGQNGVGLTQLTSIELVYEAERRGGAHVPAHQLSVGFEYLHGLVNDLGYIYGIAAYNAGPGNAQLGIDNGYYAKIQEARKKWKGLMAMAIEYNWKKYGWYECSDNANKITPRGTTDSNGAGTWRRHGFYEKGSDGSAIFKAPTTAWAWPVANEQPRAGNYQERHPTRYTWRSDVEEWARWLVDNYNVWCNTYYDHPEGYARDATSFDVWGPAGRNDPLDWSVGDAVFNKLFYYKPAPYIDWIIWKRHIYGAWNGWAGEPFGTEPFTWHDDHIHVTYK